MPRYLGIKNDQIIVISDKIFSNPDVKIYEIPATFDRVSNADLFTHIKIKDGKISLKNFKKPAYQLKVAFVGNWKMQCGISTHSEFLWPEIIKHIGDFKLFIEHNNLPTGDIHQVGDRKVSDHRIVSCWERGQSLQQLVKEIKQYDPDCVIIQHEFGLWSNARYWLSLLSQLSDYRVIVIMHSVFHHQDKTIIEAAIPEIITHLDGGKQLLEKEKIVSSKVYVIPHGCYPIEKSDRLWNMYGSEHTFIQQGFGFTYKNFEDSIRATAILKNKYPDVFLTCLFSESPHNKAGHQIYFNELMVLVEKLKLQENVAIIRGYQSDTVIDSYLRTNQVAVFPYKSIPGHEVFGVSGAARLAMSKKIPVITSSVPHFSDIPSIKTNSPEEIAQALDNLFSNPQAKKDQIEKQNKYVEENSWANIAKKYVEVLENPPK